MDKMKLSEAVSELSKAQNIVKVQWEREVNANAKPQSGEGAVLCGGIEPDDHVQSDEEIVLCEALESISNAIGVLKDIVDK